MNRNGPGVIGRRESIRQSIQDILTTRIGERVMRRGYGSKIREMIDGPLTEGMLIRLASEVIDSVSKWEKRVNVLKCEIEIGEAEVKVEMSIEDIYYGQKYIERVGISNGE